MTYTMTDMFCGAGGSSQGMTNVPGVELALAGNHWRVAIETHAANFRDADHDCADVSNVNPKRWPTTDLLWASPECTNHTSAKNHAQARAALTLFDPDKEAERSRVTMFDVPRFAEHHHYKAIIEENVVEARSWTGFDPWLTWMRNLGYDHEITYWNSGFQPYDVPITSMPAPQSRDRMYTIFWKRSIGRRPNLDYRIAAWCPACQATVGARQRWKSTFDDKMAEATRRRGGRRPDRLRWGLYRQQYDLACPDCKGVAHAWMPAALNAIDWTIAGARIGDRDLADKTIERIRKGLAKYGIPTVSPCGGTWNDTGYPVDGPHRAFTTRESQGLVVPLDHLSDPGSKLPSPVGEPLRTQTARADVGLLVKIAGHTFERANSACRSQPAGEPLRTITQTADTAVVQPFLASLRGGGSHAKADGVADSVLPTITAGGNHHMLVDPSGALVVRNYGNVGGDPARHVTPAGEPLRVLTTSPGMGLVMRNNTGGAEMCTPADEPLRTLLTRDGHQGLIGGGFVDVAAAHTPPRGLDAPLGTQLSHDRFAVVRQPGEIAYTPFGLARDYGPSREVSDDEVAECTYRMLEPRETLNGMAFARDYVVLGSRREQVAQAGNAVTPPAAELPGRAVVDMLEGVG